MTVPDFSNIGKNAWDIFRTGYHYGYGLFKISISNKSSKNVQLDSNYTVNCDSSKADGNSKAEITLDKFGTLKQKWSSDGTITIEYGTDGKPIQGLSLTSGIAHNPMSSISEIKTGAKYKNDNVNLACSVSNAFNSNFQISGSAVFGMKDLYFGYQTGYDTETKNLTKNDIGISYSYENIGIHLRGTSIPYEGGASLFYKVNKNWDTAINGIFATRNDRQDWTIGIGTRLKIDDKTIVRLKLNKDRQMGASIQQKIYDFVKLTLSFNLDLNNLSRGDHKVGLAIDVDDP